MKIIVKQLFVVTVGMLASLALTGCGVNSSTSADAPVIVQGSAIKGRAMGGQQPVAQSSIVLWAISTNGYGTASTQLISTNAVTVGSTTPVNTDANGNFTITGDFTCPTPATTPVYLTSIGGNPGNGGGALNNNLGLMVALGPCNNLVNIPFVNMNEVTTVASTWALAPFMTASDHIGTSSTNTAGIALAMAAVNKLVNIGNGTVGGPALPAGATLPADEIYGIADILASCVNSTGGTASDTSTSCGKLFAAATPSSTAPTDTITAAMNIAQNPTLNTGALFNLIPANAAFITNLSSAPNAWTIAINYTGGGLSNPSGIATDAGGNVWVANSSNNSVTKLDNTGAAQSSASGFTVGSINQPSAIGVDTSGNAWVANAGNNTLTELNSTGTTGTVFSGNGLNVPHSITFDPTGNVWVSNHGANSVSSFTSAGTAIGNYTAGGINNPISIGVSPL